MHVATPSSAYETYGQGSAFQSVGWLKATEFGSAAASCVLIDPHWALTDAHCIKLTSDSPANTNISIGFGPNYLTSPGASHVPTQYFIHPNFTSFGVSPDIALMYFADPIFEVAPATRYAGSLLKNNIVSTVGYGRADTPNVAGAYDGAKRGHIDAIFSFGGVSGGYLTDYAETIFVPIGNATLYWNTIGGGGSPGDSGGGMFIQVGSDFQLAGLTDYSSATGYLGRTGNLQVAKYADWIDQTMSLVPEPAGAGFVMLTSLTILKRRRRCA